MRTLSSSFRLLLLALPIVHGLAGVASANVEGPVVVVVEAADSYGNVGKIRAGIARGLGVPAISLIEAHRHAPIGTLQVAIARGGARASIHYVPSDGVAFAVLINVSATGRPDRNGEWIVAPSVAAVRTSDQRRISAHGSPEILDPWLRAHVQRDTGVGGTAEVLDPFVGDPPRRVRVTVSDYYLGPEVLDPWGDAVDEVVREQARHLARPRPRTERTNATPGAGTPR